MYEEKKRSNKKVYWISALIKLAILFLIVFAVWYFIIRINDKKSNPKKLGASMSDNITYLKKQYTKYFNEENAPKYKDAEAKVYLKELVETKNSKIIYDKNGEKCSTTSSYGRLVKNNDGNYELKIYLKCKNEADSELFIIKHSDIIDTTKNDKNDAADKENNKTVNDNNDSNKNAANSDKTNNNDITKTNNSSKENSNTNSNSTNKSNNSANNKNNNASNQSSRVTTNTTTSTNKNTNQTSTQVAIVEKEIDVNKITSDPSRIVLTEYLLYKLGEGSYTVPNKKHIIYEKEVPYYKYCNNNDMQNCHRGFAKIPANEQAINDLLSYGYTEYLDYTDTITIYIPIVEEIWSSSQNKEGYIYSGQSRTHYRVN